jgi:hypothetical protein
MKYYALISLLILVCAAPLFSQEKKPAKVNKAVAELMQLERDIGQANIDRNKAFFERVEAEEFIFTDSAGGITTRAEDVASLDQPPGAFKLVSYVVDAMKVKIYGKTAVVWGRATTTSRSADKEAVSKTRFTDVFVRRDGRWQLVAGHSSRIREPQK